MSPQPDFEVPDFGIWTWSRAFSSWTHSMASVLEARLRTPTPGAIAMLAFSGFANITQRPRTVLP